MTGVAARKRSAGRWLAAGGALLFLVVGLAVAWIPSAAPAGVGLQGSAVSGPVAADPKAGSVILARTRLRQARQDHGASSMQAADAMDALVQAMAAAENRRNLPEALGLARESIRIREASCGRECPELAEPLAAYEALLWRLEDYRAALPVAERVLAIHARNSGPRSPQVARSLYLVAEAHRALGNYALAEEHHRNAVSIWTEAPGPHAVDIANSLHYLGLLRWKLDDLAGARELLKRALAMREGAAPRDDAGVAADLNLLGNLEERMGNRPAAMSLYERGRSIWEETLGKSDPFVARSLANEGRLLSASGEYAAAEDRFRRALRIRRSAFGPDHYLVARSLADLGRLALLTEDYPEAERCFGRALEIQRKDPGALGAELASTLIDSARLALATGNRDRAVDSALRGEAIARDEFLRTSRGIGELDALRYERVRSTGLDVALSALASAAPGAASGTAERVWDEIIRSRAMVLDAMVSGPRTAAASTAPRPGLADVARSLPGDAALVGFVKFTGPGDAHRGAGASYLALVLLPNGSPPAIVPLGEAKGIEAAVREWREEAGTDPRLAPDRQGERLCLEAGQRLRHAIWDPLVPALEGRRMVFVVPEGSISLVSLAALPGDDGRYLIESGPSIHYLSAERDLVAPERPLAAGAGVLALGAADFDAPPGNSTGAGGAFRGGEPTCSPFRALRFDPLPGSLREVSDLESSWKGEGGILKLTGPDASEEAFKRLAPGRRILHLATHGYFLQDGCPSSLEGDLPAEGGVVVGENPLRLSGLALAGANRRTEPAGAGDDGILTAEEIGSMDLSGTEWAVLSGCETGLGQVVRDEGVLGLRRAFKMAGVATLIMTLWPVDDGAAGAWTRHLYEGRFAGLSTVEASRRASLRMIASQRGAGRSTHPYFWGAFVAAGDWR